MTPIVDTPGSWIAPGFLVVEAAELEIAPEW